MAYFYFKSAHFCNLSVKLFGLGCYLFLMLGTVYAQTLSAEQLANIRIEKQGQYPINSQYLDDQGIPVYTNALINQDSTYLLQHAHNPVNWYSWGKEAFARAKTENKPILLSIGYAACHWCHVMERESFDNEVMAAYLNEHFISIKVDREQRPDLDEIYLTAMQIFSGQGGWPITAFLTPEAKPFFVASYFPPKAFDAHLKQVQQRWSQQPSVLLAMADELNGYVSQTLKNDYREVDVNPLVINDVINRSLQYEDKVWGGIEQTPKFPMAPLLALLINQSSSSTNAKNQALTNFITGSLNGMLQGAIYDQLAGGFHRYSADRAWRKPHYEKMLYDQAQAIALYTQAWLDSAKPEYRRISTEIINYLQQQMQADNGCFYSSMDADSANGDDDYYLWQSTDIKQLLTAQEQSLFALVYGISGLPDGNVRGALYLKTTPAELAKQQQKISELELTKSIKPIRDKLLASRALRSPPLLDKSQITQWNAMAISALAKVSHTFGKPELITSAEHCAESIWQWRKQNKGALTRVINQKKSASPALLVDHAELIKAMLMLYDVSKNPLWLSRAQQLYDAMVTNYFDQQSGAFFNSMVNTNDVAIARSQYVDDTIMPSGNSSALQAMVMLQQRAAAPLLKKQITRLISYFANSINNRPQDMSAMLAAVKEFRQPRAKTLAYAGRGNVRVASQSIDKEGRFAITFDINQGWHINSNRPLQKKLIATRVTINNVSTGANVSTSNKRSDLNVTYPQGTIQTLGFSKDKLSLYSDQVIIVGQYLTNKPTTFTTLKLNLQVCNNKMCLLPEEILLKFYRH